MMSACVCVRVRVRVRERERVLKGERILPLRKIHRLCALLVLLREVNPTIIH